jgi:hypothetical protein
MGFRKPEKLIGLGLRWLVTITLGWGNCPRKPIKIREASLLFDSLIPSLGLLVLAKCLWAVDGADCYSSV